MARERDVAAFEMRAKSYETGWLGHLHHEIADRAIALSLSLHPDPRHVLDVGCGTGYLLRSLATRRLDVEELAGIDPAPSMVDAALSSAGDQRLGFSVGVSERLPFRDASFDLVITTTSFDHWSDQRAGLRECARVLQPGGHLVLVDQFSLWLAPTLIAGHRGQARTKRRASRLLRTAGFHSITWHDLYAFIIKAVTATV